MRNKLFIFIIFLTIFIGINDIKAIDFYEEKFVVDGKSISVVCDINDNIFSINGSSNYERLSINDMYKINFSIDDKDYGILIDSIIIENYENGNCLEKLIFSDKISKPGSSTLGVLTYNKMEALISNLKNPLQSLSSEILDYEIQVGGTLKKLEDITATDNICSLNECKNNKYVYAEEALKQVKSYCNTVYEKYDTDSEEVSDCVSFQLFYEKLVDENLIKDLSSGCGFISNELYEKLDYILDIIKIAAPLLAIGLGMLDFIKVIAAGDADKEMKTAFNRFSRRLIAAALLFIIPSVLSLILNIFLHNEPGYDEDNPFCNLVDYESKNNN